jgi:anti-sigma factor RsiW
VLQHDQHLTTEQLSAFLDQQLPIQEQERYQAHLGACEDCRTELAGLQQTVALLRSLPPLELPRSFMLPLDIATTSQAQNDEPAQRTREDKPEENTRTRKAETRRPARLKVLRIAVRTMGTLAAVLGIFLLASALLSMMMLGAYSGAASLSTTAGEMPSKGVTDQNENTPQAAQQTPSATIYSQPQVPPATSPALNSSPEKVDDSQNQPSSGSFPNIFFFDLNAPAARLGIGLLLLMFGGMGLILTRKGDKLYPEQP